MNLNIVAIRDPGVKSKERLVLKVIRDDDIGIYVVFDTTFDEKGYISNKVRHSYWFPDKKVSIGDYVVLYTKSGSPNEKLNKANTKSHFFYWGLDKTIWNKDGDCAVLLEARNWAVKGAR